MSTGSQQATKAAPKHTHNERRLSKYFKYQVLRRPIYSIAQCNNAILSHKHKWQK